MTDREKAISYLADGHALLRAYGLYGSSEEDHVFAIDRALGNLTGASTGALAPRAGFSAPEAAAALQALYEAKRLVTTRSAIDGRRIILGDWFMSLAVGLALPLRTPLLTEIISMEFCQIGADANRPAYRASRKAFCKTVDKFTDALCSEQACADTNYRPGTESGSIPKTKTPQTLVIKGAATLQNKLLSALDAGYFKTAALETRAALAQMEAWFSEKYASGSAGEMDGWIYGAIMSGGKRLRPMLVRLCAGFGNGFDESSVINIMSTIELMHSASLVHDDIVDRSPLRRSRATINAEKGDGYAAMCGFKMIADSLKLSTEDYPEKVTRIIAQIPMQMCIGELHQFDIENRPELQSEEEYYRRIGRKTATLIEGSCACGAILGGSSGNVADTVSAYGRSLGLLFQLRDDLLDYTPGAGAPGNSGKPISQDMERGIYSLPLLHAMEQLSITDKNEAAKLDSVLRKHIKSASDLDYLNLMAEQAGGLEYARDAIEHYRASALSTLSLLPQGAYTEALALLVNALAEPAAPARQGRSGPLSADTKVLRLKHAKQ